jgi:hypothetical protein
MKFPEDFISKKHAVIPNAKQWVLEKDNKTVISIVGGSPSTYGNGVTTFEMYDFREGEPQGYLTKDAINKHLQDNPFN